MFRLEKLQDDAKASNQMMKYPIGEMTHCVPFLRLLFPKFLETDLFTVETQLSLTHTQLIPIKQRNGGMTEKKRNFFQILGCSIDHFQISHTTNQLFFFLFSTIFLLFSTIRIGSLMMNKNHTF